MTDKPRRSISEESERARVIERVRIIHAELASFPHPDAVAPQCIAMLAAAYLCSAPEYTAQACTGAIQLAQKDFQTCADKALTEGVRDHGYPPTIVGQHLVLRRVAWRVMQLLGTPVDEGLSHD